MSFLFRTSALFVCTLLWLVTASGCGEAIYGQRVENAKRYFAYIEKLDLALAAPWRDSGVEIRIPRHFQLMQKPKPQKNEDGELVEPEEDPRQPDYMNYQFPGLLGAWQTTVSATVNGMQEPRKAYIYVLSNYEMFRSAEGRERAAAFSDDLLTSLSNVLSIPEDTRKTSDEQFPKTPVYIAPKRARVANLRPTHLIEGTTYAFDLYQFIQGDVQVTVAIVFPADSDANNVLGERVPLMFETMKLTGEKPRTGSKGNEKAAAPSAF